MNTMNLTEMGPGIFSWEPGTFLWWIGRDSWSWAWTGSLLVGFAFVIYGCYLLGKSGQDKANASQNKTDGKSKLIGGAIWLVLSCVALPLTGYVMGGPWLKGGPWLNEADRASLHTFTKEHSYLAQRQDFFGGQAEDITKAIAYLRKQTHRVKKSIADIKFMLNQELVDPGTDQDIEAMYGLLSKTEKGIEDLKHDRSLAWQLSYKLQHQPSSDLRHELDKALKRGSDSAQALIDMYKFMGTEQDQQSLAANEPENDIHNHMHKLTKSEPMH